MPKTTEVTVSVTDIPEVVELLARLRDLLQAWEPRVNCPQCGRRYVREACGPTHASVLNLVYPMCEATR